MAVSCNLISERNKTSIRCKLLLESEKHGTLGWHLSHLPSAASVLRYKEFRASRQFWSRARIMKCSPQAALLRDDTSRPSANRQQQQWGTGQEPHPAAAAAALSISFIKGSDGDLTTKWAKSRHCWVPIGTLEGALNSSVCTRIPVSIQTSNSKHFRNMRYMCVQKSVEPASGNIP